MTAKLDDLQQQRTPTAQRPVRIVPRDLAPESHLARHQHPWPQLTMSLAGSFRVMTDTDAWIVPPARAIWIPPAVPHEVLAIERVMFRTVYLHAGLLRTQLRGTGWQRAKVIEVSPLLHQLVPALDALDAGGPAAALGQRARLLTDLLLDEVRLAASVALEIPLAQQTQDKRLQAICAAVLARPRADAHLATLGAACGASERTAARLFKAELGTTFGQWRQRVVMAHAQALLAAGNRVGDVADRLGYASPSAFSAAFAHVTGQSPRAARGLPPDAGA
jgi:AraC-like DNA-binding protein